MTRDKQNECAINVSHLSVAYKDNPVLWDINISIPSGILLAVAGPNGAGKTTFIKSILGLVKPIAGTITIFNGTYVQFRHEVAYIPQRTSVDWDFPVSVLDVVLMGRYGHLGWFKRPGKKDYDRAYTALEAVDLISLADRHISQLSGGQQQRVFLARALVQDATIYLMDEPFAGVDIVTEKKIIALLQKLCSQGNTIVVVHHDLQTLDLYFDWVLLLNVRQIASGPVREVLMPEYICAAYGNRNIYKNREHVTKM